MICPKCSGAGEVEDDRDVGAKMRAMRLRVGISGREIARKLNFSPAYISDLELGRRHWNTAITNTYLDALK